MNEKTTLNPYVSLANDIVLQACKDYKAASKKLLGGKKNTTAKEMKDDCIEFFHSGWLTELTGIDPDYLIRKLDEEVQS